MRRNLVGVAICVWMVLASGVAQPAVAQEYLQHNMVSDGAVPADLVDPALVNAWGLVSSATSPWWVANNGTGTSTLYNGNTGAKLGLTVSVPGDPTGAVFNAGTGFVIKVGMAEGPARFMFASEDGTISGWNSAVTGASAVVAVNRSAGGSVYKGLAIASTASGDLLYATDFHNGKVDVFDANFASVAGGFEDKTIPAGYAPFGIRTFDNVILVTYALQDANRHDDVPGEGHGFINMFDTAGKFLQRVAARGQLNSPWGMALAPTDFGKFGGDLLVGNFGNGRINAYAPRKSASKGRREFHHRGSLHVTDEDPLVIDGLWGLAFGNDAAAGPSTTLFFTAGPFKEQHGLFGRIVPGPSDEN